jgi:hypothetical protein
VLNVIIILSDELGKHDTKIKLETIYYLRHMRSSYLVLGSITTATINVKIKKNNKSVSTMMSSHPKMGVEPALKMSRISCITDGGE